MLALLLSFAIRLLPLRIVRPIITAAAAAPTILVVRQVGRIRGGRAAGVRVGRVPESWEVALDLAECLSGASLVALEEDDLYATRGEERAVPEIDELGRHG